MMTGHNLHNGVGLRQLIEDHLAEHDVLTNSLVFLARQWARLAQNAIENADLTHVVQHARDAHYLPYLIG